MESYVSFNDLLLHHASPVILVQPRDYFDNTDTTVK